jgi:NitT/TauT family transport system ATP-binding protein
LLLMDEPFGALDAQTRLDMQELVLAARERSRPTVLFVTHDVEDALFLSDRVAVMTHRPGRIDIHFRVPFVQPRDYETLIADPEFGRLKRTVVKAVRHGRQTSAAPGSEAWESRP